jgi:hypothetical protein
LAVAEEAAGLELEVVAQETAVLVVLAVAVAAGPK